MLGSILRYMVFIALVAAATWGIFLVLETPGHVIINFADRELRLTPFAFIVAAVVGFLGLLILFKVAGFLLALGRFIAGDDSALTRFFWMNRERKGFDALSRAITAVASGDGRAASVKISKAEKLLERPEITRLVAAQAAEMTGSAEQAKKYYKALAEDKQTAFVGVKGLLAIAQTEGDEDRALKLAQQANSLKPKQEDVLETLYTLQSRKFDWQGARRTLAGQRSAGYLPRPEANRRDAMLALAQAEDAEELGQSEHARNLAVEAAKLDPENGEAVATAARHLANAGSNRAAMRLISKAWALAPSPQLAAAFAGMEPDESTHERVTRFKKLFDVNSKGTEANLIRAELALSVEDWNEARSAMAKLEEDEPSARSCAIMAAISRGQGEPDAVVRGWLARALGAPRGTADEASMLDQAAMLPLLVGDDAAAGAEDADIFEGTAEEARADAQAPEKSPA